MHIKTIAVTYGRKWNMGDYESAHLETAVWADLDEDEDAEVVMNELWTFAKAAVKEESLPLLQHRERLNGEGLAASKHITGG